MSENTSAKIPSKEISGKRRHMNYESIAYAEKGEDPFLRII